jgi:nesprin-1
VAQILQGELPNVQKMLETALHCGKAACSKSNEEAKEEVEKEMALLQEEYNNYVDALTCKRSSLEVILYPLFFRVLYQAVVTGSP